MLLGHVLRYTETVQGIGVAVKVLIPAAFCHAIFSLEPNIQTRNDPVLRCHWYLNLRIIAAYLLLIRLLHGVPEQSILIHVDVGVGTFKAYAANV